MVFDGMPAMVEPKEARQFYTGLDGSSLRVQPLGDLGGWHPSEVTLFLSSVHGHHLLDAVGDRTTRPMRGAAEERPVQQVRPDGSAALGTQWYWTAASPDDSTGR
jgi:hypothetical protein